MDTNQKWLAILSLLSMTALAGVLALWLAQPPAGASLDRGDEIVALRAELAQVKEELRSLRDVVGEREAHRWSLARKEEPSEPIEGEVPTSQGDPGGEKKKSSKGSAKHLGATEAMKNLAAITDVGERRAAAQALLSSLNFWPRTEAIVALMEFDPEAAIAAAHDLIDAAAEEPKGPWGAIRVIDALGHVEGYPMTHDLYQMYESDVWGVSMTAARALDRQGDPSLLDRELDRWSRALEGSRDQESRLGAIWALGATESPRAVPHLAPLFASADWETRVRALEAFARVGQRRDITSVEPLLNDPIAAVRDRALETIAALRKSIR